MAYIHPGIFLDSIDINSIKSRLNQSPWFEAYNILKTDANESKIPYNNIPTIMDGPTPPNPFNNSHYYYTRAPYCYWTSDQGGCAYRYETWCCDGRVSPNSERTDYNTIQKFRDAVRSCGLAYVLSGDTTYADTVVNWIKKWCLDPSYKMNPKFTYYYYPDGTTRDNQPQLEIAFNMVGVCYGADLIWNTPQFNAVNPWDSSKTIKQSFISWMTALLADMGDVANDGSADGWGESRLIFICAASIITDNTTRFNNAINVWKGIIDRQVDTNGSIKNERNRTTGLSYSAVYLNQLLAIAEMAYHQGNNLYHYVVSDTNRGPELALDYHVPWIINPTGWPYNNNGPVYYKCINEKCTWTSDTTGYYRDMTCGHSTTCLWLYHGQYANIYELAYTRVGKKDSYKNVITFWGGSPRYMYDDRNLGPVTLTHGSPFGICNIPVSKIII